MVGMGMRMRKLRSLLAIRLGPGAAILPPEVTKIHMDFAYNIHDGHYGPRKFWRNCLPRLKYHNPTVSMTVNRTQNQDGPALMTVHYKSPDAVTTTSSTASKSLPTTSSTQSDTGLSPVRLETINMKHRSESEILDELMKLTEARVVRATAEELRQIQELEEANRKREQESMKGAILNAERKREKALMEQARGDMGVPN